MNCILRNFVDESVLVIYSSGPIAGERVLQRLRLANTLKRAAFCFLNEIVDTAKSLIIRFLPIDVIVPGMI